MINDNQYYMYSILKQKTKKLSTLKYQKYLYVYIAHYLKNFYKHTIHLMNKRRKHQPFEMECNILCFNV